VPDLDTKGVWLKLSRMCGLGHTVRRSQDVGENGHSAVAGENCDWQADVKSCHFCK